MTPEEKNGKSRLEKLINSGKETVYPDDEDIQHLIKVLLEIKPARQTGFGPEAISWVEIKAFCSLTGLDLDPWSAEAIFQASQIFSSSLEKYNEKRIEAPVPFLKRSVNVDSEIRSIFGSFKRARSRNKKQSLTVPKRQR